MGKKQDKLFKNHLKWKHYHSNVVIHYRSTPSPLSPDHRVFVEMYVAITHHFAMLFYHLRTEITKKTCKLIGKQLVFILLHWLCFSDMEATLIVQIQSMVLTHTWKKGLV